jgi:N-glycosylase/DNA lyase
MAKNVTELKKLYEDRKREIRKRLQEFGEVLGKSDEEIFCELAFCITTPQSKAINGWNAICSLAKNRKIFCGDKKQIRPFLNNVRFADNKSRYIIEARELFTKDEKIVMKEKISGFKDTHELRNWLAENVKGIGMKEASHFLRNIGMGKDLAILDVHILKNLLEYGVIDSIPKTLTKKRYLEIENKVREFSEKIGIPMDELDLLLWSKETGKIFK